MAVESSERGGLDETAGWSAVARSREVGGGLTVCPSQGQLAGRVSDVRSRDPLQATLAPTPVATAPIDAAGPRGAIEAGGRSSRSAWSPVR